MQKVFNVLAVASFLMSGATFGAGVAVYTQRDAVLAWAQDQVFASMGEALGGELGRTLLSGDAPDLPDPVKGMDVNGALEIPVLPF